jgi:hypothetical protein
LPSSIKAEDIVEGLSNLVAPDAIRWVMSEADVTGSPYIYLVFEVSNARFVKTVNLILRYLPLKGSVLWGVLEIVISPEIEAYEFMGRVFRELTSRNYEVIIDKEGIFLKKKLGLHLTSDIIIEIVNEVCGIIKDNCGSLIYVKSVSVGWEESST